MDKKQKLEQTISNLKSSLEKAQKELTEPDETTYSIGDRFKCGYGKRILAMQDSNCPKVFLINLKDGSIACSGRAVGNIFQITQTEFDNICCCIPFTRYWDSQRKVLTESEDE
uniref:Uncharacterized protein n=2 Tax=viral metagenome TaxID=1070528 RepID=A0A6H1ZP74_9ZZZZ